MEKDKKLDDDMLENVGGGAGIIDMGVRLFSDPKFKSIMDKKNEENKGQGEKSGLFGRKKKK